MQKLLVIFLCLFFNAVFSQVRTSNDSEKKLYSIFSPLQKAEQYVDIIKEHSKGENYELYRNYSDSLLLFAEKHELISYEITALSNLGIYYKDKLEYEKALSLYHRALEKSDSLQGKADAESQRTRMLVLLNMGNVYNDIGSHQKAINAMQEVVSISKVHRGSEIFELSGYNGLGFSYFEMKDFNNALPYFVKVKELAEAMKNHYAVAISLNNISDTYINLGNYTEAIKKGEESLLVNEKVNSQLAKTSSLYNLGNSYLHLKELEKAIEYYTQSLAIASEIDYKMIVLYCHRDLAKAYELSGNYQKAVEEQKQYTILKNKQEKEKLDATKLDAKEETKAKDLAIKDLEESVTILGTKKKNIVWVGSILLLLLGGVLFFYIKKKKAIEAEGEKLKTDYVLLSDENQVLKIKMQTFANLKQQEHKDDIKSKNRYQNSSLTEEDRKDYMQRILDYMETERPYLNFDISQSDLAAKLSISDYHLSEVLNVCFEKNFYNFINIYRVNEAQRLMKDPTCKADKILSIGYDAGFSSKTSFNRVFKTYVGLTPSEYRKQHGA